MTDRIELLRLGALGGIACTVFAIVWWSTASRDAPLTRAWSAYVGYLDRNLKHLFLPARGRWIALGQLLGVGVCLTAALSLREMSFSWLSLLVTAVPLLSLTRMRRQRLAAIEARIESFLITLANALKSSASIGGALTYAQPLLGAPLDQELDLALKEMRVGSGLDQALLNMASRVQSPKLDAALASVLIGRQVGGNLPQILETTASTLREMARLQGVVRSKTAEGKSQLFVLALFPALLVFLFDWLKPNYFAPLLSSVLGVVIGAAAIALWIASIVVARKVLMVEL